jgi:hypothetical protein
LTITYTMSGGSMHRYLSFLSTTVFDLPAGCRGAPRPSTIVTLMASLGIDIELKDNALD